MEIRHRGFSQAPIWLNIPKVHLIISTMRFSVFLDVTSFFVYPNPRGIGTYVFNLANELNSMCHLFLSIKVDRLLRRQALRKLHRLKKLAPPVFLMKSRPLFRIKSPILFHGTDLFLPRRWPTWRILTLHDLYYLKENIEGLNPEYIDKKRRRLKEILEDSEPDAVITPSFFVKRELEDLFPNLRGRVRVVYHGVSPIFREKDILSVRATLERLGLSYKGYFLFLGFADQRKNLGILLQAYEELYPDPLVVVGTPPSDLTESFSSYLPLLREGRVRLVGVLGAEEIVDILNGATALVMPSFYEGFGLPVLEAMACGTPVVASRIGTLEEVTGGKALFVDPMDPEDLRQALLRVREDEELRADLTREGKRWVRKFTWKRSALDTLKVYNEVVGGA